MYIPYNPIFNFIKNTCKQFDIDESHGIKHSMEVFDFSYSILQSESKNNPDLLGKEKIIYTAALLHDMCDNKYMDEEVGIKTIKQFLITELKYNDAEINAILDIIGTMSYSKVKKNRFPDLGEYQMAYHIVREADLLAAYDIDRCIIYTMMKNNVTYEDAFIEAKLLYYSRMGQHIDDGLFTFDSSKKMAVELNAIEQQKIKYLNKMFQ